MSKLTKAQAKLHAEAEAILKQDRLTDDERLFVIENWHESARHINSIAGAFFTPWGLARDFSLEVPPGRIIDLCAGMGTLSLACLWRNAYDAHRPTEIVCIEANPDYAAVGRKLVPEARWVVADIFDLPPDLGRFDAAISNPPFGSTKRARSAPRYAGRAFEYHAIDIASDLADQGAFIIPQNSAPFRYSGCPSGGWPATVRNGIGSGYHECPSDEMRAFLDKTGIVMEANVGIDTGLYLNEWHGVSPLCEVVTCDFVEARQRRQPAPVEAMPEPPRASQSPSAQIDLFEVAA